MTSMCWHAYFYEGLEPGVPPILSDWIEAENANEALAVARGRLGAWRRAELVRPSWEDQTPTLLVVNALRMPTTH
ncbi:MAG: hypothetical protein ACLPN5_10090 [Roseiarcus sp.]